MEPAPETSMEPPAPGERGPRAEGAATPNVPPAPVAPNDTAPVRTVEFTSPLHARPAAPIDARPGRQRPDGETPPVPVVLQPAASFPEPAPSSAASATAREAPPAPDARETVRAPIMAAPEPPLTRVVPVHALPALRPRDQGGVGAVASEEAGPVVVVNIGRIEVRAMTPPAAAAAPRARPPAAVSLEEYLRPKKGDR